MDAVKFLKEKKRMCMEERKESSLCVESCPLFEISRPTFGLPREATASINTCDIFCRMHPEEAVARVEEWSEKHPVLVKTRADDFMEKHPRARTNGTNWPVACAKVLGYCKKCTKTQYGMNDCRKCWNMPLEER